MSLCRITFKAYIIVVMPLRGQFLKLQIQACLIGSRETTIALCVTALAPEWETRCPSERESRIRPVTGLNIKGSQNAISSGNLDSSGPILKVRRKAHLVSNYCYAAK